MLSSDNATVGVETSIEEKSWEESGSLVELGGTTLYYARRMKP